MLDRVLIRKFCELSGHGYDAIYKKCNNGVFTEGKEFFRAPDNHYFISISGFEKWVESTQVLAPVVRRQSKSRSPTRIVGVERQSTSSLRPLI